MRVRGLPSIRHWIRQREARSDRGVALPPEGDTAGAGLSTELTHVEDRCVEQLRSMDWDHIQGDLEGTRRAAVLVDDQFVDELWMAKLLEPMR
jgi:hypothetical protein